MLITFISIFPTAVDNNMHYHTSVFVCGILSPFGVVV